MLNQNTKDTVKNLSFFLKNNFRKNTDLNLPQLIFQKFIENDNKKIISILMRCLYIYQKHLKIKKLKYFYQFYQKSIKKEKINIKNIQQRLFDDLQKRKQSKKNLEKKFNEEEEKICTFSPKINNDKFNIKYLNDPIIIVPATSRVYNLGYKKNIFDFEKLLNNFIEKSSTINVDKDYKEKDNYKSNDLLEKENKLSLDNYSTKNTFYKNTRTIPLLNNRNIKNTRKIKYSSSSNIYKLISTLKKQNPENKIKNKKPICLEEEKKFDFPSKTTNTLSKTNYFLKINTIQKGFYDTINNNNNIIPKTCRKAHTSLNLLEKKPKEKINMNKIYNINNKINKIYSTNFEKKNNYLMKIFNRRKIQLMKKRQKANTINTNNETKGCSASTLSAKNSKRDSTRSNISNYTTNYKTITSKRNCNKNNCLKNELHMTLQSISDSKMMELAEFFINKKEKDELLDDICIKKILCFRNDKIGNKNKNITFSE